MRKDRYGQSLYLYNDNILCSLHYTAADSQYFLTILVFVVNFRVYIQSNFNIFGGVCSAQHEMKFLYYSFAYLINIQRYALKLYQSAY